MKKTLLFFSSFLLVFSLCQAQEKIYPAIQGYGAINTVPFETVKPDPEAQYKFVMEVYYGYEDKTKLYGMLDYVARVYNAHIYGGVPAENLDFALVIFSGATPTVLTNEEFQKRFEMDNPNLAVLDELKRVGVRVIVCGQSMMKQDLQPNMIHPGVELYLSRITATTDLINKGYKAFAL